jgi:hypothetical protein
MTLMCGTRVEASFDDILGIGADRRRPSVHQLVYWAHVGHGASLRLKSLILVAPRRGFEPLFPA